MHLTPDDWTAGGTVVTAGVAVLAAAYARSQVRLARQTREDQTRPFVVVDFALNSVYTQAVDLVVENIGQTLATNVRLSFEPPLKTTRDDKGSVALGESVLLREGIPTMPPRKRITALFDIGPDRIAADLPSTYSVTVSCKDGRGKQQDELTYTLDLGFLYGLHRMREYGIHDMSKAIGEIEKTLKQWSSHDGLKVRARDGDYDNWSDHWQYERSGDTPSLGNADPAGRPTPSKFKHLREPLPVRAYWYMKQTGLRRWRELRARRGSESQ
jgi:hypothetical protein